MRPNPPSLEADLFLKFPELKRVFLCTPLHTAANAKTHGRPDLPRNPAFSEVS